MKERTSPDQDIYNQLLKNRLFVENNTGKYLLVYGGQWKIVQTLGEVPGEIQAIGQPVTYGVIHDPKKPLPELGLE